jgi:hypothetical protein
MQPAMLAGEVLGGFAARVAHTGPAGIDRWLLTATSLLVLFAVGGAAAKVSRQLIRRSTPELIVLLDQSAAFYSRWPEDQHVNAPSAALVAEAARCRRIVELLEQRTAPGIDVGPASRGPIDGLLAWIAVLHGQLQLRDGVPSGAAYA